MRFRPSSFLPVALTALTLISLPLATNAQTLTILHSFGSALQDGQTPGDGAPVIAVGSTLYGTTQAGGTNNSQGTIFAINTDGTGYTVLHQFGATGDGSEPESSLTLAGATLYGTTLQGGTNGSDGTVFAISTNGTGYTILHEFGARGDGTGPEAALTLVGSTLYGTTQSGGPGVFVGYGGTIFAINTDGSGYTNLYVFGSTIANDGQVPDGALTAVGSRLYGTTYYGGANGYGSVFAINTNGSDYAILNQFTGSNGDNPETGLTLAGATLYGTTFYGGTIGAGTVFAINPDGSGFTNLHEFEVSDYDGQYPNGALTWDGTNQLYGTTTAGGFVNGSGGTIYVINTDGSGYTILNELNASTTGPKDPRSALTLVGSTLYGASHGGGAYGAGTVFAFDLCTFAITTNTATFTASGGLNSVTVTPSGSNCVWTAASDDNFITITAGTNGLGNGTVNYSVAANTSAEARTGTVTVAGQVFTVIQAGSGVLPTKIIGLSGSLAFGNVLTGTTANASLTIRNSGNTTLTVSSIGYPDGFNGPFIGTIAAGSSHAVTVSFSPLTLADYGGTVSVTSDATSGTSTIAASGTGVTMVPSSVAAPAITPDGGNFADSVKVTLKSTTAKAVIYYTVDGSTPTTSSPKYKSAVTLTNSVTLNAVAYAGTNGPSDVTTAVFAINSPSITSTNVLPDGAAGTEYTPVVLQATGGTPPYKWSLAPKNKLPSGLKLASTGTLSGKPKTAGSVTVTIKVTDAKKGTAEQSFTLTIN